MYGREMSQFKMERNSAGNVRIFEAVWHGNYGFLWRCVNLYQR
jgi:hypothetical protein